MGHIKTTEEGKKNFTIANSANWSGMQLFPQPSSLFIKKKAYSHLMASQWTISHRKQLTPSVLSHMAPGHTETQRSQETLGLVPPSVSRCRKPARGAKKCLTHSTFSAHQHAPWNKGICLSSNAHVLMLTPTFPHHPFSLSSHLVWSKAFPVHLLSHPPRWLSNKSC